MCSGTPFDLPKTSPFNPVSTGRCLEWTHWQLNGRTLTALVKSFSQSIYLPISLSSKSMIHHFDFDYFSRVGNLLFHKIKYFTVRKYQNKIIYSVIIRFGWINITVFFFVGDFFFFCYVYLDIVFIRIEFHNSPNDSIVATV